MRTGNPALKPFEKPQTWDQLGSPVGRSGPDGAASGPLASEASTTMTVQGTAAKTGILLAICAVTAIATFVFLQANAQYTHIAWLGSLIPAIVLSLVVTRSMKLAPVLAPPLAVLEGVFVGAFSLFVAVVWIPALGLDISGVRIVGEAVSITFGILAIVLVAYSTGLIRIGSTARKIIAIATLGVFAYYLVSFVLALTGIGGFSMGWAMSPLGIGFSLFVVTLASLNLVLAVQDVDEGVKAGMPKAMEWVGAAGLLVTLVWLYIEVLRLLVKLYYMFNHE